MSYNPTSCPKRPGHILTNVVTGCHSLALKVTPGTLPLAQLFGGQNRQQGVSEIPSSDQFPAELPPAEARRTAPAGSSLQKAAAIASPLLTRNEAAGYCRISLRTFDWQVAEKVPRVRIGCRCLYDRKDIDQWLERHKVGSSIGIREPGSIRSGSASAGSVTIDPLARRIAQRLRARLPDSFAG